MSNTYKVKIVARLRPRINGEIDDDSVKVVHDSDYSSASTNGSYINVANPRNPSQIFKFPFASCYDHSSTQEEIFVNDVQPMIDVVYSGVTVTIFAYGVTSSGKTHTMQGTKSDPGVIPRVVRAMFAKRSQLAQSSVALSVSYMEVYKDEVYDLLVTREHAPKLPVRENDAGQVFVANLTLEPISSVEEFDALYARATKHRSVGATNLNRASSRSHAILTIRAHIPDPTLNRTLVGKINLVDLAGSENNKLTGNDPSRMAESSAINKSLSVLGQVVHALNQNHPRIPYRNSKLTRILQDALGGSSLGLLICNIAPGTKFRQDTLNTLNFAVRTKNIENKPIVHERENPPVPKPHFAASGVPPPVPKGTILPAVSGSVGAHASGSQPSRTRASLVPVSRTARASFQGGGSGFAPFALPTATGKEETDHPRTSSVGLTDKDIDERISKAVELEVARRLEERERQREKEENERQILEQENHPSSEVPEPPQNGEHSIPSGVLTPLLKRHKELDEELMSRLQELERKLERGSKEVQLAGVLSPVSRKKTGRAYVALARAHSEKGDLQVALDLYRKAESYVPDNVKLKERIIEIEWAVRHHKPFAPSPKRSKRSKVKKSKTRSDDQGYGSAMDADEGGSNNEQKAAKQHHQLDSGAFGALLTNVESPNKGKRSRMDHAEDDENVETPAKRRRRDCRDRRVVVIESSEDELVPPAPAKKGKTRVV